VSTAGRPPAADQPAIAGVGVELGEAVSGEVLGEYRVHASTMSR
jgi:hypothetical protein